MMIPLIGDGEIHDHLATSHGIGRMPSLMAMTAEQCHTHHAMITPQSNHSHGTRVIGTRTPNPVQDFMAAAWQCYSDAHIGIVPIR